MRSYVLSVIILAVLSACSQSGSTVPDGSVDTSLPTGMGYGDSLAMACSNCHAVQSTDIADISAMTVTEIETALNNYKSQGSGTTVMHRLVRGYSEADIKVIAQTLGSQND